MKISNWFGTKAHEPNHVIVPPERAPIPLDVYTRLLTDAGDQLWENTSPSIQATVTQVFQNSFAAWLKPRLLVTYHPDFETRERRFRSRPMSVERPIMAQEAIAYAGAQFTASDYQSARSFDIMLGMVVEDNEKRTRYVSFPGDSRTLVPWV